VNSPDLIIRGGSLIDGTGAEAFAADIEVTAGKITFIGTSTAKAPKEIDALGAVVAPGFIDIHTHYDAQAHFEPTMSPSSWHGVTTAMMGNCGFSIAPADPESVAWLINMLSRVEGMEVDALLEGVDFRGGDYGDFLNGLEGRIGINLVGYVGHCAIRRLVMGAEASERAATHDEITQMAQLVRTGFSSSQLDIHSDHEGKPVPSNLAEPDELIALCAVLSEFDHGVIEFLPRSGSADFDAADQELLLAMSTASGFKLININPLTLFPGNPEGHRNALAFCEEAAAAGHHIHPMYMINVKGIHFSLDSTFVLDEMPTFRRILTLPMAERAVQLGLESNRAAMRGEFADTTGRSFVFGWQDVSVASVSKSQLNAAVGRTIAELAAESDIDGVDAMIDLALADALETVFVWRRKTDPALAAATKEIVTHPLTLAGSSDGGAHLLTFCGADYTTRTLTETVPDMMTLEQAVARLTSEPAQLHGLNDRGLLAVGMAADIVVFTPDELGIDPITLLRDFPTGAGRLVFGARGYNAVIVNGEPLFLDGEHTGALPGAILRP
jgi:N-acyl-D-aspartate/D-glutamate deacylase